VEIDIFPILSKNTMLLFLRLFVIIFDVTINSNNFTIIIKINHIGIILKYAKAVKDKIVYMASERMSNFVPVSDAHFNFLARKPSATSDIIIVKNVINKNKFFVHS
jgi:hypothetical protein